MRILFVQKRYHTNQQFIMKTLINRGHSIKYIAQTQSIEEDYSIISPDIIDLSKAFKLVSLIVKRGSLGGFSAKYGVPSFSKLYRSIKDFDPEVIVIKKLRAFSLFTLLVCKLLRKKNIIIITQRPKHVNRNVERYKESKIYKLVCLFFGHQLVRITHIEGDKKNGFPIKDIQYLPFVVDFNNSKEKTTKYSFRNNKVNIISVGKYTSKKNQLLLLNAVKKLKEKYSLHLTIIGQVSIQDENSYYKKVIDFIKKNDMLHSVEIKTNISHKDVQYEYRKNDLFILPFCNGVSMAMLEAMHQGLPIISNYSFGSKTCIEEGMNGLMFVTNSLDDLISKIETIIQSKHKMQEMGAYSSKLIKTKHSPDRYYNDFVELLYNEFKIKIH